MGRVLTFVFGAAMVTMCTLNSAQADVFDDAVGQWAKQISSHLASDEIAQVTWNPSGAGSGSAVNVPRAKALLAKALQRRLKNAKPVEVTATVSRNLKGDLLIAELHRENETIVEMAALPRTLPAASAPTGFHLERRLLWDQEAPILDVVTLNVANLDVANPDVVNKDAKSDPAAAPSASPQITAAQMLVLDPSGVTRYEQKDSTWRKVDAFALDIGAVPVVRDPRGRLTVTDNMLAVEVPGQVCHGAWRPVLLLECQSGGRFTAGRNTMEEAGSQPFLTKASIGSDQVILAADGRTHVYEDTGVYDGVGKQTAQPEAWGDFAVVLSRCTGAKIVASDAASGSLAIYDLVNHTPVRVSDATEMPGLVTSMWPAGNAAIAVVHVAEVRNAVVHEAGAREAVVQEKEKNRYEAYGVSISCDR